MSEKIKICGGALIVAKYISEVEMSIFFQKMPEKKSSQEEKSW